MPIITWMNRLIRARAAQRDWKWKSPEAFWVMSVPVIASPTWAGIMQRVNHG